MLIRDARPQDETALRHICLVTGDAGRDATALMTDGSLLGDIFAVPYLRFEPRCALVAEDDLGVSGYILGAADTEAFQSRLHRDWWPALRARHPLPEAEDASLQANFLRNFVYADPAPLAGHLRAYPAHLHVDLLPRSQGQGVGRRLMAELFARLAAFGAPGVHWGVDQRNGGALAFYRRLGAQELAQESWGVVFGARLGKGENSSPATT